MLILDRTDIQQLLRLDDVIEAVERAHVDLAAGDAVQPGRPLLELDDRRQLLVPMTAAMRHWGVAGVKLLADVPGNRDLGLPVQQSTILLVDLETGTCRALLDGAGITRYRTAAASAVATRHLSRPDSSTLGLVGAGALADMHLQAIAMVRDIDRVVVWSRTAATADRFAAAQTDPRFSIEVCDHPEDVVRRSDIVCTLTPARTPVLAGRWLREGTHLNVVGAPPRDDHREVDTDAVVRSHVVVDSLAAALQDSGDVLIPLREGAIGPAHVQTEIGDVITGRAPGRTAEHQITLYDSVGVAVQDIATAALVVTAADEKGLGTRVALDGVA